MKYYYQAQSYINVLCTEFANLIMMFSWQNKRINHEINDIITSPFILYYYILTQMQLKSESYTSKAEAIPMMENSNFIKFRFTHLCSAFGFYLLAINFSLFIREALGFEVINVGNLLKMIKLIYLACFTFI